MRSFVFLLVLWPIHDHSQDPTRNYAPYAFRAANETMEQLAIWAMATSANLSPERADDAPAFRAPVPAVARGNRSGDQRGAALLSRGARHQSGTTARPQDFCFFCTCFCLEETAKAANLKLEKCSF